MKRLGIFAALAAATTACNDAVQPGPGDLPPVAGVAYVLAPRVEVDDSITVSAAHGTGIAMVGWEARLLDGTLFGADSAAVAGDPATASRDFLLGFQLDRFDLSKQIRVTAFAVTASGERLTSEARAEPAAGLGAGILFSRQGSQLLVTDTVVVVAGVTRALPNGGRIADAAYNRNLNEIYLTNIERDRLEVFQIADTTFDADGIPIGAQPWGIALWPRNQSGVNADTVVVANSGGTNLSVVNVASRTEVRRHALPNFIVQSVQTEIDPATGDIKLSITEFDFSDRPQHVGTFCRVAACTDVYALYSTTPTAAQQMEFPFRGTVRWENLTNATPESHFFWEQAEVAPSPESDTLQVLVDRGPGTTIETVLSAACGRTVNLIELGFIDTTFVRNSGNFTHALIGEGGSAVDPAIEFARVVGYDGTDGTATANCTARCSPDQRSWTSACRRRPGSRTSSSTPRPRSRPWGSTSTASPTCSGPTPSTSSTRASGCRASSAWAAATRAWISTSTTRSTHGTAGHPASIPTTASCSPPAPAPPSKCSTRSSTGRWPPSRSGIPSSARCAAASSRAANRSSWASRAAASWS
jgi:hypothetical protein